MPAAMHLALLVSLFTVIACADEYTTVTTEDVQATGSASTRSDSTSPTSPTNTAYPPTTSGQVTTAEAVTATPSSSPQTPNATEETQPTSPALATTTNQTNNVTESTEQTLQPGPEFPQATDITASAHTTAQDLSHNLGKSDTEENPGLVAVLCIFIIVVTLILVVTTVKCIRSPRSNFERLEDVPMGKVNEESPFAHYSK